MISDLVSALTDRDNEFDLRRFGGLAKVATT